MTDFSESLHPRRTSGEFAVKTQSASDVSLTPPMPGTPVFVGWDRERETWHLEDGDKVIEVFAGVAIAGVSSPPVGRRQEDGSYVFAYVADPDELGDDAGMTLGTVTLGPDDEILLETAPGTLGYEEAERQLAALRGGIEGPAPAAFDV